MGSHTNTPQPIIDTNLQSQLRDRFNPEGSELRRLQLRLLGMLEFIDRVCSDNGITYWLSSGTCLGAVRHGGFIPWDDDVDIEMLEKDYRKLLKVMGTEPKDGFVLQTRRNDPTYRQTHAKLRDLHSVLKENNDADTDFRFRGAFIDVFHMRPSSSRKLHDWAIAIEKHIFTPAQRKTPKGRLFLAIRAVTFPVLRLLDSIGAGSTLRHPPGSFFTSPRRLEEIFPVRHVPFEGLMLPIPGNADAYLRRMFGDYTRLPDLDSIPSHFSGIKLTDD